MSGCPESIVNLIDVYYNLTVYDTGNNYYGMAFVNPNHDNTIEIRTDTDPHNDYAFFKFKPAGNGYYYLYNKNYTNPANVKYWSSFQYVITYSSSGTAGVANFSLTQDGLNVQIQSNLAGATYNQFFTIGNREAAECYSQYCHDYQFQASDSPSNYKLIINYPYLGQDVNTVCHDFLTRRCLNLFNLDDLCLSYFKDDDSFFDRYCSGDKLTNETCIAYCNNHKTSACIQKYTEYCNNHVSSDICACFLPETIYNQYFDALSKLNVNEEVINNVISTSPVCFYPPCAESKLKPKHGTCPNISYAIVNCISNVTIDNQEGIIDTKYITIKSDQKCKSILKTQNPPPPEQNPPEQNPPEQNPPEQNPPEQNPPEQNPPEQNPPEQNPTKKSYTWLYILIGVTVFVIIITIIILI